MDTVNVVSLIRLEPGQLQRLEAVDGRLRIADGFELARVEEQRLRRGEALTPQERQPLDRLLAPAHVLYTLFPPQGLLARAPQLRWVQVPSHGVERWPGTGIFQSAAVLTNARGAHTPPIVEHVLMEMLMFARGALPMLQDQAQRRWRRFTAGTLRGKTLGVVGLGSIGEQVARLALALNMKVVGVRRSAQESHVREDGIRVLPASRLKEMLGESDFVLISAPATPQTARLIGEAQLRAMKPSAYLLNVSRGHLVDEAALLRALKEGWIAGAGLDVFQREPLPPESELWGLPNVIISPHISGSSPDSGETTFELLFENLRRFLGGQPLLNVVDKEAGY